MTDFFEDQKKLLVEMLDKAKNDNLTGCVVLGEQANNAGMASMYYLMNGVEVSKEKYILESGMEHLLKDQTHVKCTKCGRKKTPDFYKKECGTTWDDDPCTGIFF